MFAEVLITVSTMFAGAVALAELGEQSPTQLKEALQGVEEPKILKMDIRSDQEVGYLTGMLSAPSGSFVHGFISTFCVIVVSELGDKTFFIAVILAMRHSRAVVLGGAIAALAIMHIMSALFGASAFSLIPKRFTLYASSFLFVVFGLKMLREGYKMSSSEGQEEMEEVQEELRKREVEKVPQDLESGQINHSTVKRIIRFLRLLFPQIFIQAFTMTFLAEWGDRSQLATIVLASREDTSAVVIAGVLGHSLCTGLAVLGGRFIAQKISVRTVTLIGGIIFLLFAVTAIFMDPDIDG